MTPARPYGSDERRPDPGDANPDVRRLRLYRQGSCFILAEMLKLLRASNLLAVIAAIMLVVGGVPARAAQTPCNPCPPDCPMMAQMHMGAGASDHGHQAPAKGKPDSSCKPGLACQAFAAAPILSRAAAQVMILTAEVADLSSQARPGGASRPPDPTLRPPRRL